MKILDVGGKVESAARKKFPNDDITMIDLTTGWDVMEKGLPSGDWDLIYANHVIEHFSRPETFLFDCYGVMNKNTILEIGTPNLNCWFNRILFLLGWLPHFYDASNIWKFKRPYKTDPYISGHCKVYNTPTLIELLKIYNFEIISVEGEPYTNNPIDKFFALFPNLASCVRIRCKL